MSTATLDYSQYSEPVAADKLAQLSELARQQSVLLAQIEEAEKTLKDRSEQLKTLSEHTIPTLMDELQIKEFSTSSGLRVSIGEAIRANIPKARMDEAIVWLDDHGFANLVKRAFIIEFGKEQEAWANKFAADLRKRKAPVPLTEEKGVHNRTLAAFVKEQLGLGTDIPLDLFGVFRQRFAKVEVPKAKR